MLIGEVWRNERPTRMPRINTCLKLVSRMRQEGRTDDIANFEAVETLAQDLKRKLIEVRGGDLPDANKMQKELRDLVPRPTTSPIISDLAKYVKNAQECHAISDDCMVMNGRFGFYPGPSSNWTRATDAMDGAKRKIDKALMARHYRAQRDQVSRTLNRCHDDQHTNTHQTLNHALADNKAERRTLCELLFAASKFVADKYILAHTHLIHFLNGEVSDLPS
jgi:hypothetical protein